MKTAVLVRHAKAENQKEGLSDFSRSLVKDGMKDAESIAKKIKDRISGSTIFISSPAARSLETAHIFAGKLDYPAAKILLKEELYKESSPERFFDILKETEDIYETVVLFGHNPVIGEFASLLTNGIEPVIPKSGVIAIGFACTSWKEIEKHAGILKFFKYPAERCEKTGAPLNALGMKIAQTISEMLEKLNPDSSRSISKSTVRHAGKIAKNFAKDLWQNAHEKPAD